MAALDAGVPLRDVQIAAPHADLRTTTIYDRRRQNLDLHAAIRRRRLAGQARRCPHPFSEIGQRLHRIITESGPELEPVVRWGLMFYVQGGEDICYIEPDKHFIVFGVGEALNLAREHGANMHPGAWTLTSLDSAAEERISALVKQAAEQPNP